MRHLLSILIAGVICGCIPLGEKNGAQRTLILGLGFVSATNAPGASVHDLHTLGLNVGTEGIGAGWIHRHKTIIDPKISTNIVISTHLTPFSLVITNRDFSCTNNTSLDTNNN